MTQQLFHHFCDTLPQDLHPLDRMMRVLDFCKETGFHWSSPLSSLDKIREELSELEVELKNGDTSRAAQEFGDLFHALLHAAALMELNSTQFLNGINDKFENRLKTLEKLMSEDSMTYANTTLDQKLSYWKHAKKFDRVA